MGDSKRKVNDGMDAFSPPSGQGTGVGASLREARQRLGVELRDVAEMLRIRFVFLQAIEDGRYADLPGNAYAAGFLRSYAEYLGMDADMVVRRFKEEVAGRTAKQELYFPTPVPEGRVPGGAVLLAVLVLAGTVYGGWYYLSATDRSMVDLVPALPDRLVSLLDNLPFSSTTEPVLVEDGSAPAAPADDRAPAYVVLEPTPVEPAGTAPADTDDTVEAGETSVAAVPDAPDPVAPPPTPSAAPPAPAASLPAVPPAAAPGPAGTGTPTAPPTAGPVPAAGSGTAEAVPPAEEEPEGPAAEPTLLTPSAPPVPAVAAAPAAAEAEAASTARTYGTQNQDSRVQLRATQDSWVQVRDGKGELLFTRVLRPGDVYRVPDRPGVRLRTGNAGGLVMVVDGVAGSPLGANGQVLRDIALDAP